MYVLYLCLSDNALKDLLNLTFLRGSLGKRRRSLRDREREREREREDKIKIPILLPRAPPTYSIYSMYKAKKLTFVYVERRQ